MSDDFSHGYMNDGCPCRQCTPPTRFPGCHGSCIQYIDWDAERKARKQLIQEQKRKEGEKRAYVKATFDRQWRKNGWKTKK